MSGDAWRASLIRVGNPYPGADGTRRVVSRIDMSMGDAVIAVGSCGPLADCVVHWEDSEGLGQSTAREFDEWRGGEAGAQRGVTS